MFLLLLLVLALAGCSPERPVKAKSAPEGPPVVAVSKVARQHLSRSLELAADFRPFQEVEVHAKVAGYLKDIRVDVGDHVQAGQLLATVEVPELTDEATQAAAQFRHSQAEVTRAHDEIARAESGHAAGHASYERLAQVLKTRPNLVAQQEIDEAMARDRMGEAQVSAAKSTLAAAEQQVQVSQASQARLNTLLAYSRITAPFAGVITHRYADTGAMIQAGTASQTQAMPLVRLSQVDRLRLVLPVPESVVPRVRVGTPVEVRVPALNRTFQGRVARFAGRVQVATRTMDTEVDVPNPRGELTPGLYAYTTLTLDERSDALAVPVQALATQDSPPTVLVVGTSGVLEERGVKLGLETPNVVEVLSGLSQGDLVVVAGRNQLKPGQTVQPRIVELGATEGGR
jgi:RND family efflux transporter MFP subunit